MPLNQGNSKDYTLVGFDNNIRIEGIDTFAKSLEKHFFSKVTVRNLSLDSEKIKLVIELTCNFDFMEALTHLKKEIWGSFLSEKNSFSSQLQQLKKLNDIAIEVEEFSIFLNDTSIIINKIYNQSISEQLEDILHEMLRSYPHFTKEKIEIPYEIYIPVYEDNSSEILHLNVSNSEVTQNFKQNYFSFWGVYFYSEIDAMVYDLKNKTLIDGTLQMLTR